MAQLRHAQTSRLVAEGTPLELVLVARELGLQAVVVGIGEELPAGVDAIYDDVGLGFDPAAVLEAHDQNVAGLEEALVGAGKDDKEPIASAIAYAQEAAQAATGRAAEVKDVLDSVTDNRPTLDPVTLSPAG